mmetsp:Transcript_8142/g.37054  ORF Transcript_8142/g.37054 Transcript_8142/m.37054 type:complete len:401 (-) Transcript_8142:648-1850(-)
MASPSRPLDGKFLTKRKKNYVTGTEDLEPLATFNSFPVGMYCVPVVSTLPEWTTDMTWMISKSTGAIQLSNLIDVSILYDSQHESGAIGGLWRRHHEEFCLFIQSFCKKIVLEIGGGHGNLARMFVERNPNTQWIIVEPNMPPSLSHASRPPQIVPIEGWFDGDFQLPQDLPKVDVVVHSHTFEHMYDYDEFFRGLSRLKPSLQIFSVPHQQEWLRRGWQNSIMFEHPQLLTPNSIEYMMRCHGFTLLRKEIFADSHSIFYAFAYDEGTCKMAAQTIPPEEYGENKNLFNTWLTANKNYVARINDNISAHHNQDAIFVFGAHIFTQYLVAFGLKIENVAAILDNAPDKQGKRLYGMKQIISSPEILRNLEEPAVILRVGAYADEIKKGIRIINPKVIFWE